MGASIAGARSRRCPTGPGGTGVPRPRRRRSRLADATPAAGMCVAAAAAGCLCRRRASREPRTLHQRRRTRDSTGGGDRWAERRLAVGCRCIVAAQDPVEILVPWAHRFGPVAGLRNAQWVKSRPTTSIATGECGSPDLAEPPRTWRAPRPTSSKPSSPWTGCWRQGRCGLHSSPGRPADSGRAAAPGRYAAPRSSRTAGASRRRKAGCGFGWCSPGYLLRCRSTRCGTMADSWPA